MPIILEYCIGVDIETPGDCLDMVLLGAGWDKERARELLGTGTFIL